LFLVYSVPLVLAVSLLSVFGVMERPDLFFLDRAFQWRDIREPRPEVAIVAISQQDFERGAPRWPWPRSLVARLLDQVSRHRPAVIVVDILYSEESNTETVITREQFAEIQPFLYQVLTGTPLRVQTRDGTQVIGPGPAGFDRIARGADSARAQDLELARAVQRAADNGVAVVLAAQAVSQEGVAGVAEPYQELAAASGESIGLVGVRPDADGVLRRYLPYGRDKDGNFVYGLALMAIAQFKGTALPASPAPNGDVSIGPDLLVKVSGGQFLVDFPGPPGTHQTYVARDVLKGEEDFSGRLKDKIVFIGVTDPSVEDMLPTPFSGTNRMAGVEFHSAAADTLLGGSFIGSPPRYQIVLMVVVLGFGAIALGRFIRPLFGFGGTAVLLAGLLGAWTGLFMWAGFFLPVTAPLTAVLAGFAFAVTDRVSVEQLEKQQARSMLSRYLPPWTVKEMLKNPAAARLGGRRADLTVLFSDIRGFTTLSEQLNPEEVVGLLNEYLTMMTEIIFRHGGTVDKFEGDAILAFFGAPLAHDDDPERAVQAALEMRDRLGELEKSGGSLRGHHWGSGSRCTPVRRWWATSVHRGRWTTR
jgi:adenylate cyclase